MKTAPAFALGLLTVMASGCVTFSRVTSDRMATATLADGDGLTRGSATIARKDGGLVLSVTASGLKPGEHGMHLHTTGTCAGPDFASAGGHLNPDHRRHGSLSDAGPHLGDLPNLKVDDEGRAVAEVPLTSGGVENLFDSDGTAVVVHADADDYRTDPSGNSGKRVLCGVLDRSR